MKNLPGNYARFQAYYQCMAGSGANATEQGSAGSRKQQAIRKRTLKRFLRPLTIRGSGWYRGEHVSLENIDQVVTLDTYRDYVKELYAKDAAVTQEVLGRHGLWGIVSP